MKRFSRFAAFACVALAIASFVTATFLARRGDSRPALVDLVWFEPDRPAEQAPPDFAALGLIPGDRLRILPSSTSGQASLSDAIEQSFADVAAQRVWVCRSERDVPQLASFPQGVSFFVIPWVRESRPGWEFRRVVLPSVIREGRPFLLRWEGASLEPCRGKVRVWLGEEVLGQKEFALPGGKIEESLSLLAAKAGVQQLRLEALEGIAAGRPREIAARVEILPRPAFSLLGNENAVSRLLESQGFVKAPVGAQLGESDLLLVAKPLSGEESESVEEFLRAGGGAIVFGSESWSEATAMTASWLPGRIAARAASAGLDRRTSASSAPAEKNPTPGKSPVPAGEVNAPIRETRQAGVLALMLVLDKSGSMAGEKLDRTLEAALETAKTLAPGDWLGLYVFDREVAEIVPLSPLGDLADLRRKVESIDAGGGTRIFPALQRAAEALQHAPAAIRHLILLTDGATEDKVAKDAPYFEFMSEQARRGLTLTTVGIRGGDYDAEFLSNLAVWGRGRFYPVDPERIPQIFTLEAKRVKTQGNLPQPQPDREESFVVSSKDPHPALQGIDWQKPAPAPPLLDLKDMQPWPWSSVALLGGGRPLLAMGHVGQGRVALWASAGEGDAVSGFLADTRARQFWVQLAEYLRRRRGEENLVWHEEGADLTHRLRSQEETLREVAAMATRCGGRLVDSLDRFRQSFSRESRNAPHPATPWVAAMGAVFSLLGMILFAKGES